MLMEDIHQKLELYNNLSGLHSLESYVERICDEYNIFNDYFGIILMSLNGIYEDSCKHVAEDELALTLVFENGSKGLIFKALAESNEILAKFELFQSDPESFFDDERLNVPFLLSNLSDRMYMQDGWVVMEYDIANINQELAQGRVDKLKAYFKGIIIEDKSLSN